MTARLGAWFAACLFVAFAFIVLAGPVLGPAGPARRARAARHPAVAASTDPPPPDDPLDPAWTPPDGRWHHPHTFHDVAARHPCMIGATA